MEQTEEALQGPSIDVGLLGTRSTRVYLIQDDEGIIESPNAWYGYLTG